MSTEIQLGFKPLPVPHYYLSKSGVSAASVAVDFGLSPFLTQVWQYTARAGKKSTALEDIISDLEKVANFAVMEIKRIVTEAGGTVDYESMVARFEVVEAKQVELTEDEFDTLDFDDRVTNGKESGVVVGFCRDFILVNADNGGSFTIERSEYANNYRKEVRNA